jgi:hypothetical protein
MFHIMWQRKNINIHTSVNGKYNKTSFLVQIKFIPEDSNGLFYKY